MAYTEISGKKLRARLGAQLNESAAQEISKTSFAARQMAKMGWKEGEGLGKHRQGMKSHIKVKQRVEEEGIGMEKVKIEQASQNWWQNSMGDTLAKLNSSNESLKQKKKKKKRKRDAKRHFTDEELFEATGGARFGMRAQSKQTGKWARAEAINEEEETLAKTSVEWDGTGKAKFFASEDINGFVKRSCNEVHVIEDNEGDGLKKESTKIEKEKKKKKIRKKKVNEIERNDDEEILEENIRVESTKKEKKIKKEKKKKKQKKVKKEKKEAGLR